MLSRYTHASDTDVRAMPLGGGLTRRAILVHAALGAGTYSGLSAAAELGAPPTSSGLSCRALRDDQSMNEIEPDVGRPFVPGRRIHIENGMVRSALALELDADYTEYRSGYIIVPTCFFQPFARTYMHEVLHFWQTLSHGYITRLALEEWRAARTYHDSGDITPTSKEAIEFRTKSGNATFSAQQLSEALCRFWDIHIYGPGRLSAERHGRSVEHLVDAPIAPYLGAQFDLAMTEDDAYAEPYRWILKQVGSNASVLLFPLIGNFALNSQRPIEVFLQSVEQCLPFVKDLSGSIHVNWRGIFDQVYRRVNDVSRSVCGTPLKSGWEVIDQSSGIAGSIWEHFLRLLIVANVQWRTEDGMRGARALQFSFATPGDPTSRKFLTSIAVPPLTLFGTGQWVQASSLHKLLLLQGVARPDAPFIPRSAADIGAESLSIRNDYAAMQAKRSAGRYGINRRTQGSVS